MLKIPAILFGAALMVWKIPMGLHFTAAVYQPAITVDGPYVFYQNDSILVQYIDSANGQMYVRNSQWPVSQRGDMQLTVQTDEPGITFDVKLKSKNSPEKSTYGKAKKMLVVSDIEGNFSAFRKLLQANGVIDKQLQWTFGNGKLILLGDFVDRGAMVTEVLWLIYALEMQAATSGGKVHYILGNHEIMNMAGEETYVNARYIAFADSMKVPYAKLFSKQTELGRWLATKNVAENIGNILFVHAGISSIFNQIAMPLEDMNDSARMYYADTSAELPSPIANLLFSDYGPFWYRGYYHNKDRATLGQIDSTLELYRSRHIVVGHSIVAKEIGSSFGGKIINTDLHHDRGFSEALLIDGNAMYRVDAKGERREIVSRN